MPSRLSNSNLCVGDERNSHESTDFRCFVANLLPSFIHRQRKVRIPLCVVGDTRALRWFLRGKDA